jgi:hypothetical protein
MRVCDTHIPERHTALIGPESGVAQERQADEHDVDDQVERPGV